MNNTEPAFPGKQYLSGVEVNVRGMTLRAYFAAKALSGLLVNQKYCVGMDQKSKYIQIANEAVYYADELLEALEDKS
jgi:hypothetical protein